MTKRPASTYNPYVPNYDASELHSVCRLVSQQPITIDLIEHVRTFRQTWCSGVVRSAREVLASILCQNFGHATPLLWITPSNDAGERLYQDLPPFLDKKTKVALFPEKEHAYMLGEESSTAEPLRLTILQELEGLAQDKNSSPRLIIIASIRALLQPTVRMEKLQQGKIVVHKEEQIDSGLLLELLINEGYKRVPMVEKRGELSVRGDIFDIYPITGQPVRIELFGDEVESIRSLKISTQRSDEELTEVTLLPADEGEEEGAWLTDYLIKAAHQAPLLVFEELNQIQLTAQEWYQEWTKPAPDQSSDVWERVEAMLTPFNKIYLTGWNSSLTQLPQAALKAGGDEPELCPGSTGEPAGNDSLHPLVFPFEFTPGFSNRVNELMETLPRWQEAGGRTVIYSRQYLRLRELLGEHNIQQAIVETKHLAPQGLQPGEVLLVQGYISEGFRMHLADGVLEVLSDHEISGQRRQRRAGQQTSEHGTKLRVEELNIGDLVVHLQHGIGRYVGVETLTVQGTQRDLLHIQYARNSSVYVPINQLDLVQRYEGVDDNPPPLSKMGSQDWSNTKKRIQENVREVAQELLKIYAQRQQTPGYAYPPDGEWQHEMEDAFPYQETPDQLRAIGEVKHDLEQAHPMDRLVCGDVGFGKTEVALRAAFKVLAEGRQVAVLVPTTVLAQQHYQTFTERLSSYPVKIGLLSRFRTEKEQTQTVAGLANGEIDVAIGTHRLLSQDVDFFKLGLLIIDEEHKFGVMHKERLKQLRGYVDVLTMSATPIPRTLQMSIYGMREMSLIETPPAERLPIKTYLFEHSPDIVKAAITRELGREGQVFLVHNRVMGIERLAADVRRLVPQARIAVGHGQMPEGKLEKVMMDFYDGEYDVLICTTIIESGLDMPNVNTIIINNADKFGLAQLYQLRGRVGRAIKQGYCYLLYPPSKKLTAEAEKRLETIRDFTNLGAGYQVARRDLEIRGAGNILGAEQSGHVAAVGFSLYCDMLNEEMQRLKGEAPVSTSERTVVIDIPVSASLPNNYVSDARQKVALYRRLAKVQNQEELQALQEELRDRYGVIPAQANNLLRLVTLKLACVDLLIPSIRVKDSQMTILAPFLKELNSKQRYKLSTLTGWPVRLEPMAMVFEGLYGKAAGSKQYPDSETFLNLLDKILELLRIWRDEPQPPTPPPKSTPPARKVGSYAWTHTANTIRRGSRYR